MKSLALLFFLTLGSLAAPAASQAEIITIGGEDYECAKIGGSQASCWEHCPNSFNWCQKKCGGGQGCWDKCPGSFNSCLGDCGPSPSNTCWDKCPGSFKSCKDDCGGGSGCWDRCTGSFNYCQSACGTNGMPAKESFEKTASDRILRAEKQELKQILNFE